MYGRSNTIFGRTNDDVRGASDSYTLSTVRYSVPSANCKLTLSTVMIVFSLLIVLNLAHPANKAG